MDGVVLDSKSKARQQIQLLDADYLIPYTVCPSLISRKGTVIITARASGVRERVGHVVNL
jgi:hypothetical protein